MLVVYVMNLIGLGLSDEVYFNYLMVVVFCGKRYGKWVKLVEDFIEVLIIKLFVKWY